MNPIESAKSEIPVGQYDETVVAASGNSAGKRNLTLLMLVLAGGTGAATLFTKHGPQSTFAAPAQPTTGAFSDSHAKDVSKSTGDKAIALPDEVVAKIRFSAADVQVPLANLKCDPFQPGANSAQPRVLPDDPAEIQRREQERQAALDAVQTLHLGSIQHDEVHRACTINGALYQEGQEVDEFVIEEIATSTVVVRKGVYRFELRVR